VSLPRKQNNGVHYSTRFVIGVPWHFYWLNICKFYSANFFPWYKYLIIYPNFCTGYSQVSFLIAEQSDLHGPFILKFENHIYKLSKNPKEHTCSQRYIPQTWKNLNLKYFLSSKLQKNDKLQKKWYYLCPKI
jgi:hypothetical protein